MLVAGQRSVRGGDFESFVGDPWPFKVPVNGGFFTLVDADDFELIARFRWNLKRSGSGIYAFRSYRSPSGTNVGLTVHHSIVGKPLGGLVVDHINGHGLDNRRANLRVISLSANGANSRANRAGTSGFKGVHLDRTRGTGRRWVATIHIDGSSRKLGRFRSEHEAAAAYDEAAWSAWGTFARLNFPERIPGSNPASASRRTEG